MLKFVAAPDDFHPEEEAYADNDDYKSQYYD
jgi:hypothetical protein